MKTLSNTVSIPAYKFMKLHNRPGLSTTYSEDTQEYDFGFNNVITVTASAELFTQDSASLLAITKYTYFKPTVYLGDVIDSDHDAWIKHFEQSRLHCDVCGRLPERTYHIQTGTKSITTICNHCANKYGIDDYAGDLLTDLKNRASNDCITDKYTPDLWDVKYAVPLIASGITGFDLHGLNVNQVRNVITPVLAKYSGETVQKLIVASGITETHIDIDSSKYHRAIEDALPLVSTIQITSYDTYGDVWT